MQDYVVLVDEQDQQIGTAEKLAAHRKGLRHRALSVFIFDTQGRLLIQQRAASKYHCAGLWANSCCSHPHATETVGRAAERRCQEELGATVELRNGGVFSYSCAVGDGLSENEVVHLFWGCAPASLRPNASEVRAIKWISLAELDRWRCSDERVQLAPWFAIYLEQLREELQAWSVRSRAGFAGA